LRINWKQGGLAGAVGAEAAAEAAAPEVQVQARALQVPGLDQVAAAAAAAAAVGGAALWAHESRMFSDEARPAPQAGPLQAPGRDHHHHHHQAIPDRAGRQVGPVQDLLVLGLQVEVLEGRRLLGRRRPTLGAGTPLQLTKDPQWGRHWEDQELPTLALDHPLVREVLSSQGRQGGLLGLEVLHLVGEDSHNLNRATVAQACWGLG